MTPEAQRIAIAEACGFRKPINSYADGWVDSVEKDEIADSDQPWRKPKRIPDYLSDLNAMHEAEKVLTRNKRLAYGMAIREIVGTWPDVTFASASQRAEAFLRTLNLWDD